MKKMRVFLVDDEPLALKRLSRLLLETGRVEIAGQATEPLKALEEINKIHLDAIFLDIQMPELSGFELLQKLENHPPVIFTTAFDKFALEAFEVYSVDYLLKPVETERLAKALEKLGKLTAENPDETAKLQKLLAAVAALDSPTGSASPAFEKIGSRIGGRVLILDLSNIICFLSEDKLTFAQDIEGRRFPVDFSLAELERKLQGRNFLRVHRSALINTNFIEEVHGWFSGRVLVKLKGSKKLSIAVARDRVKILKDFFGI